jgi:hypothetical protein
MLLPSNSPITNVPCDIILHESRPTISSLSFTVANILNLQYVHFQNNFKQEISSIMWHRQGPWKYIYITSKTVSSTHLLMLYPWQCFKWQDSKITYIETEMTEGGKMPRYTTDVRSSAMWPCVIGQVAQKWLDTKCDINSLKCLATPIFLTILCTRHKLYPLW